MVGWKVTHHGVRRCPIREWTHLPVFTSVIYILWFTWVEANRVLGNQSRKWMWSTWEGNTFLSALDNTENWYYLHPRMKTTTPWALQTTEIFCSLKAFGFSTLSPNNTYPLQRIVFLSYHWWLVAHRQRMVIEKLSKFWSSMFIFPLLIPFMFLWLALVIYFISLSDTLPKLCSYSVSKSL